MAASSHLKALKRKEHELHICPNLQTIILYKDCLKLALKKLFLARCFGQTPNDTKYQTPMGSKLPRSLPVE